MTAKPPPTEEETFEQALVRALEKMFYQYQDFLQCGISDADLQKYLYRNTIWSDNVGPQMYCITIDMEHNNDPRLWVSKDVCAWRDQKPTYSGKALLKVLRKKLKIPYPNASLQMNLFYV